VVAADPNSNFKDCLVAHEEPATEEADSEPGARD